MKKNFRKWATSQKLLTPNSLNKYISYLNYPASKFNLGSLTTIEAFFNNGDILYALSYCDKMVSDLEGMKAQASQTNIKDIQDAISAYKKLSLFLCTKRMACTTGDSLDQDRNRISKSALHKIDGIEGLVAMLGVEKFVKMAVEESFFFHPSIINERHEELLKLFGSQSPIPARKTTKEDQNAAYSQQQNNGQWKFVESNLNISIERDKDGNQNVRKIIKGYTGYTVGEGKGSIFQNYIISHIWGRAYDPRYFTSLWNIVLIPAWANPLMDKVNPDQESFASLLQSTLKKICEELYFGGINNWGGIQMQNSPGVSTTKDVIHGDFNVNIIGEKISSQRNSLVAPIKQSVVKI